MDDLASLQTITAYFIFGVIVLILLYDVFAFIKGGTEATVSYTIIMKWSRQYPAFTFAVGFVMGHLFWPLQTCF